ncbi:MAG: peptidoglycan DD-metalloendopeptidase family protein [Bacteroidota bacterium]
MKVLWTILGSVVVVAIVTVAIWYYAPREEEFVLEQPIPKPSLDTANIYVPTTYYGYIIDSMDIVHKTVEHNEFLANILTDHNVSNDNINLLVQRAKGIFDIRKIGVRKAYELICYQDDKQTAKAMIYHPNEIDYVIMHLEDSVHLRTGAKEVITKEKTSSGIIYSSLAMSMDSNGLKPQLTNDMADIFAWEVDFFRLFPGDRYKLIYEEKFVDGKSIGYGAIKGAVFEHADENFYAFYHDQGSGIEYFDEEGNSLRKTFLKYPVKFSRISSRYSGRRFHPVLKRYKSHLGTDFAAPQGTPIRTVGEGVVVEARYHKYNGNYVKIKHNSVYSTQYLHMVKIASGIRPGVKVKQGQTIGYVGHTGLARGNHVCYRFWKYGQQVDALRVDLPSSEPVADTLKADFTLVVEKLKHQLESIAYPEKKGEALSKKAIN